MKKIWVVAHPGQSAPKETVGSGRITDTKPEEIPVSRYYSRLLLDGSLRELSQKEAESLTSRETKDMQYPVETEHKKAGKK